jgi:hypothetical protein
MNMFIKCPISLMRCVSVRACTATLAQAIGWFMLLTILELAVDKLVVRRHQGYSIDDSVTSVNAGTFSLLIKLVQDELSTRVCVCIVGYHLSRWQ